MYCLCEHFFTDYFSFFFPIFTWTVHFLGIFTWIVKFVFHFLQFFFVFIFFLHYLHEESFSFLHCFYYCVTIHMNSEPFFTIHIIFFLLLQLMSLFKWIVHLFSIFFHYSHDQCNFQNCLHGDIFFIFFPAIVLHYSHQQSILVKKFQHYSHSWTNSSNNNLACCMYIVTKASPYRRSWKDPWSCIMWEFDGETRAFLRVRQTQEEVWHSTIRCTTSMERGE